MATVIGEQGEGWVTVQRKRGALDRGWFTNLRPDIFARGHRLVACSGSYRFFYAAVEEISAGQVLGVVIEKSWQRSKAGNFAYRVLDEAKAGLAVEAAERVLEALSPTDDPEALAWRARVSANLAKHRPRMRALEAAVATLAERIEAADDPHPQRTRLELEQVLKLQRRTADLFASDDRHAWRPE